MIDAEKIIAGFGLGAIVAAYVASAMGQRWLLRYSEGFDLEPEPPDVSESPVLSGAYTRGPVVDDVDARADTWGDACGTVLGVGRMVRTCTACGSHQTRLDFVQYRQLATGTTVVDVRVQCGNCPNVDEGWIYRPRYAAAMFAAAWDDTGLAESGFELEDLDQIILLRELDDDDEASAS